MRTLVSGLAAAALACALPDPAAAQGSAVYTQSACMNARNGAGMAYPCADGSAIYYNPAAIAWQNGAVSFGITMIDQTGAFIADTTTATTERQPRSTPVAHGWAAYRLSPRLGVGIGLFSPYGLAIDWPSCPKDQPRCGSEFEGRFVGYDQSMRALYLQPTVAYDLVPGRIAIGGGVDIVKADVEINRTIDLAPQPIEVAPGVTYSFGMLGIASGTDFADLRLSGDGWGVTGNVGVIARFGPLSLGARYMHSVDVPMDGRADFTQLPTNLTVGPLPPLIPDSERLDEILAARLFAEDSVLADQNASTEITLPAQAVVGLAFQLDATLRVMLDYQWTQWSSWDEVEIDLADAPDETLILDYQDAATVRAGFDYAISDRIVVRGGFAFAQAAAKDASVSPFLPDSERQYYSFGMHYRASERLSLDFFGMALNAAERRGRVVDRDSLDQTAEELNSGLYTADGQLFGATVTYHFGGPR